MNLLARILDWLIPPPSPDPTDDTDLEELWWWAIR